MSISLDFLGEQVKAVQALVRAIQRDLAMLRAQQSELPSVAQFQAGLTEMDARFTELHAGIAKTLDTNTEALARIEQLLADINSRVP